MVEGGREDLANDDGVVTGKIGGIQATGDLAKHVVKKRYSILVPAKVDFRVVLFPFVLPVGWLRAGKEFGQMLLVGFQDVDSEQATPFDDREQVGALVHADGNQGRNEGDRSEGVGGHTVNALRGAFDGDYCNARCEMA
jgi:hypothetical protein